MHRAHGPVKGPVIDVALAVVAAVATGVLTGAALVAVVVRFPAAFTGHPPQSGGARLGSTGTLASRTRSTSSPREPISSFR